MNFVPQPYPLYAVLIERAGDTDRFEGRFQPHPIKPIQLVVGWTVDDAGQAWPLVNGNRTETWTGLVSYHTSRREARKAVTEMERQRRSVLRTAPVARLLNRFGR